MQNATRLSKRLLWAGLVLAAGAAQAADTAAPVLTHTPVTHAPVGPLKITAKVVDESRIFPQVFFRQGGSGPFEPPSDLKRVKGSKDTYEALIPAKAGPLDYYVECYDEYGNGPARSGSPEAPHRVEVGEEAAAKAPAHPSPVMPAAEKVAAAEPAPAPAPAPKVEEPARRIEPVKVAELPAPTPAPAPVLAPTPLPTRAEPEREAPREALQLRLNQPLSGATDALWHSAILPGWGQFRTDRPIRGTAFAVAAVASVVATVLLAARADSANSTYENAPVATRQEAYNQAVSYEHSRNAAIVITAGVWVLSAAEAYLGYGSHD